MTLSLFVCLFWGALFSILDFQASLRLFMHLPSFCPAICSKSDIGVRLSLTKKLEHAKDWSCSEWMFSDVTTGLEHTDSFNRPAFRKQTIGGLKRLLLFVKVIVMLMQSCTQLQRRLWCWCDHAHSYNKGCDAVAIMHTVTTEVVMLMRSCTQLQQRLWC